MDKPDQIDGAIRPETKIVWLETPSNPLMKIVDIQAVANSAHRIGARLLVDNTFATPILQRPIEQGADIVLHSATKYIGGHSDLAGGCLVFESRDPTFEAVQEARYVLGAILSPFNSWLALRGLRTLSCRVEVQSANAIEIAKVL